VSWAIVWHKKKDVTNRGAKSRAYSGRASGGNSQPKTTEARNQERVLGERLTIKIICVSWASDCPGKKTKDVRNQERVLGDCLQEILKSQLYTRFT